MTDEAKKFRAFIRKKKKLLEMKNEKNCMGFLINKIWQILKYFCGAKTLAKTSYFWGVMSK